MGVVFGGERGMKHCKACDSPELFDGEINQYGYCGYRVGVYLAVDNLPRSY